MRALHVTLTPVALGLGLAAGSVACVLAPPVVVARKVRNKRRRGRENLMYLDPFPEIQRSLTELSHAHMHGDLHEVPPQILQDQMSTKRPSPLVAAADQNYGRFSLVHTCHQEWLQRYCVAGKLVEARYPPNGRYYPATISKVCHPASGSMQVEVEVEWEDGDHQYTRRPTSDLRPRSDEAAALLIQQKWRACGGAAKQTLA